MKLKEIDFIRFILIILVITIHIVAWGDKYAECKHAILSFMMPTFLVVTGYLVNIDKPIKKFVGYILKILIPYLILATSFAILSYFLPVRDGITDLSLHAVLSKVFITSIGPYWFLHVMMVCGIAYYLVFAAVKDKAGTFSKLMMLAAVLIIISYTPLLNIKSAIYYFVGVVVRQASTDIRNVFKPTPFALIPFVLVVSDSRWRDWGCVGVLVMASCAISFLSFVYARVRSTRACELFCFVGRNTLPIYLFHPIFTMAAKYYYGYFTWDGALVVFTTVTVAVSILGGLLVAYLLDKSGLSRLFGRERMLRPADM